VAHWRRRIGAPRPAVELSRHLLQDNVHGGILGPQGVDLLQRI
jgi:hypothetical protein